MQVSAYLVHLHDHFLSRWHKSISKNKTDKPLKLINAAVGLQRTETPLFLFFKNNLSQDCNGGRQGTFSWY